MPASSITLFGLFLCAIQISKTQDWSYNEERNGPNIWSQTYPSCTGYTQSPVDLQDSDSSYRDELKRLELNRISSNLQSTLENTGKLLMVILPTDTYKLSIPHLGTTEYHASKLLFHWGSNDTTGSEHRLNGKTFGLEIQLIAFDKTRFNTYEDAEKGQSGLVVLSFLGEINSSAAEEDTLIGTLPDILSSLTNVINSNRHTMQNFDLLQILKVVNLSDYFNYLGSITTPPCTQDVMWHVMRNPVKVTTRQLTELRKLRFQNGNQMSGNFRPLQLLNSPMSYVQRTVYRSRNGVSLRATANLLVLIASSLAVAFA